MTLAERFAERIRASVERANLGSPGASYMPRPPGFFDADTTVEHDPAKLAAYVARVVTFYVEALIPNAQLRELVLEHPALVERWPLETGAWFTGSYLPAGGWPFGGPDGTNHALCELGQFERVEGFVREWPPEVAPRDAAALLDRQPDNWAAVTIAKRLREGRGPQETHLPARWPGEQIVALGPSSMDAAQLGIPEDAAIPHRVHDFTKITPDATGFIDLTREHEVRDATEEEARRLARMQALMLAEDLWLPRAVATLALVERLVLEDSALYRARRAVGLVRGRYTDTLEGLVDDALGRAKADDSAAAKPALATALWVSLDELAAKLDEHQLATEEDARALEDGVLWLDELFAAHVEHTGEQGKADAAAIRGASKERIAKDEWREAFAAWDRNRPIMLAVALWRDKVGPRLEEARRKPAGLARAVAVDVLDLYSRRYEREERSGQQALVFPDHRGWVVVPSIYDGTLASILERGVGLLASETGIDLLEWEVTEAHRQYIEQPSDFRHLSIEGGWSALAHEKLKLTSRMAPEMVRAIVLAQAHLRFESKGIRGNLLTYSEPRKHAPGQRSLVTITLGDMLLQGFTHALREQLGSATLGAREAGRLVPVLGKTALVGRNNDYAAQRRMVWRFAIAMRDHAEEIAQYGHVSMPLEAWTTLASEAGLPRSSKLLADVVRAWETGSDGAAPLIVRVPGERDRFTLHESRKPALDFIVEGGQRSTKRRAEGKAGAAKRASEHRRRVQKPR
jgi:hypothetical protein